MKRVLVIGNCGTGKSTFALRLAKRTKLPLFHLDAHYWSGDWIPTPSEEWRQKVTDLAQQDRWIIDGNYRSSLDLRVPQADTIFFLDYPRWLAVWRVIKRSLINLGKKRDDLGEQKEKIDLGFYHFVASFPRKKLYEDLKRLITNQDLIVFSSPQDLEKYLRDNQ